MAVRRHFVHFIKAFLKFGLFTPMVGSWNLHTFRAIFIAVHITFIFEKKFNMAASRQFLHFWHVFLLFSAFKAILSKFSSWFYVNWFLKLLIQQKCWHQQEIAQVRIFYHTFLRFRPFWVFLFSLIQQRLKSAVLISEFTAFPKAFSLVFCWLWWYQSSSVRTGLHSSLTYTMCIGDITNLKTIFCESVICILM